LRRSVFNGPLADLARGTIDEVHELAGLGVRWSEFLRPPPPGRYHTIIASEPKLRCALLLRRIAHDVFISPAVKFGLSDRKPRTAYPRAVFDQMRCLAALAAGRELDIDTRIDVGERNKQRAAELLPESSGYIGLAPGSAGVRKRWPLARYVELARRQVQRGRIPVFFLGPDDAGLKPAIESAVPRAQFPEQANVQGGALLTIALAQRIDAGVANDAGGGHLLAAGGRPLITLFGHTSADKFKPPYGERVALTAREYGGRELHLIPLSRVDDTLENLLATRSA
jgi:ADP-heptose:LPS heptosyltransferase